MADSLANLPQAQLEAFCRSNRIRRLAVFGSALRSDFSAESDFDILVEFEPNARIGFMGLAGLEIELSKMLGRRVDLHTPAEFKHPRLLPVLDEARPIYDAA